MQMSAISLTQEAGSLIEKWLKERQILLVAFSNLCQIRPYQETHNDLLNSRLEEFCELLIDYLCRGHFEMYTTMIQQIESCQGSQISIHPTLLDCLLVSTDKARHFDKTYETAETFEHLERDLSALGENLAQRFEWEDELIHVYLEATAWQVPPAKSA